VHQYNETNVMHFSFNLLVIKGLYIFRALLAHPQDAMYRRYLVYCVRVMSVDCTRHHDGFITLKNYVYLTSRLRTPGAKLHSTCMFMEWFLIKRSDAFTGGINKVLRTRIMKLQSQTMAIIRNVRRCPYEFQHSSVRTKCFREHST
jgi:hypothetical protein